MESITLGGRDVGIFIYCVVFNGQKIFIRNGCKPNDWERSRSTPFALLSIPVIIYIYFTKYIPTLRITKVAGD